MTREDEDLSAALFRIGQPVHVHRFVGWSQERGDLFFDGTIEGMEVIEGRILYDVSDGTSLVRVYEAQLVAV